MNLKKNINMRFLILCLLILFTHNSKNAFSQDNVDSLNVKQNVGHDSEIKKVKLYFETEDTQSSDQIIRDHLTDQFPIISEALINQILSTKSIRQSPPQNADSTLSSASEMIYRVSFEVPENFLGDTAKILWELNLPGFESKLYQLYKGQQIYIDTWPNVVGKISTKTYTGNFQAYRIRNWPFYKDPDPSKADLPPTKPGPDNPLGLFVVHYDENSLTIFSRHKHKYSLLKNKMRNLSHGCVRNDNDNIEKMKEFIIKESGKIKGSFRLA